MCEVPSRHDAPPSAPLGSPDLPRNGAGTLSSPTALRDRRRRWQDPRLWLGAVLVLGSVVIGAKVMASADDTVAVWQLTHDVPAGSAVLRSDLRVTRVHFDEGSAAVQYVPATEPPAPASRATRDLRGGELLATSALSSVAAIETQQLPLGVGPSHQPADLHAGDHVDVWAVQPPSGTGRSEEAAPALVLHDVVVVSVGGDLSGVTGVRQVLVGIGPDVDVSSVLQQTTGTEVVLIRLAG
jgi:hypothetical protein